MRYFLASLIILFVLVAVHAHAQVNVETRITTTNITLVWEADSYVPPFYKGKALMPDGGDARIVALLPPGVNKTSQTRYVWRVDGTIDSGASGAGRDVYRLKSDIFGGQSLVVVEVSNGESLIGSGAIRIPLVEPRVIVYPDAALGGVLFNTENPSLFGEELTIETYPLFFSVASKDDVSLTYNWRVDGFKVENPFGNSGRLSVRRETTGTTTVSVSVRNAANILESAVGNTAFYLR